MDFFPWIYELIPVQGYGNLEVKPEEEKVGGQFLMDVVSPVKDGH